MINLRFGKLTVIALSGKTKSRILTYTCLCDCGTTTIVRGDCLRNGNTTSCGCAREVRTHGYWRTPTWQSWKAMRTRCKKQESYLRNKITVCPEWLTFENFLRDMGERPEGMTLDRKNPYLGYFKENCRWADKITQANNKCIHWQGWIPVYSENPF